MSYLSDNFDAFQEGIINGGYDPRVEDNHPVQGGDDWMYGGSDLHGEMLHGDYRDEVMQDEYEIMEDDGQPDEYTEWQDYMGGDDWDHGQYDSCDW